MKKKIATILGMAGLAGQAPASLIAYYNMEQGSSPIVDQVGGELASAVDGGHQYGVAGPTGFGNAVGLNANGSWQLSVAERPIWKTRSRLFAWRSKRMPLPTAATGPLGA